MKKVIKNQKNGLIITAIVLVLGFVAINYFKIPITIGNGRKNNVCNKQSYSTIKNFTAKVIDSATKQPVPNIKLSASQNADCSINQSCCPRVYYAVSKSVTDINGSIEIEVELYDINVPLDSLNWNAYKNNQSQILCKQSFNGNEYTVEVSENTCS